MASTIEPDLVLPRRPLALHQQRHLAPQQAIDRQAYDRSAPILIGIEANWHDAGTDDANVAWARRCYTAMRPFSDGRMYFNFPGPEDEAAERIAATYGANLEQLAAIKRKYDPDDLFRTHQNIPTVA